MLTAYCIVQNGVSHVSTCEVIASVLSIQNIDSESAIYVSCSQECRRLCTGHPLYSGDVKFYIQDDERGVDSYLSRVQLLVKNALASGYLAFILGSGTLVVRPLRLDDSLKNQGIGFIDRRPNVYEGHMALHFLTDVLFIGSPEWLQIYIDMSTDVEGLREEPWYEETAETLKIDDKDIALALSLARLVRKYDISKFMDSRILFSSDSFLLKEDAWKPAEVDDALRRKEMDIFLVNCKKKTLDLPGGSDLFSAMLNLLAKNDPYYIMLFPMSISSLSQGISFPSPSSLPAWNREKPVSRMAGLVDSLCNNDYFSKTGPQPHALYFTLGTSILYDAVGDSRCTPHLAGGTTIVYTDYDDSLLVCLKNGDFAKKSVFLGYLPYNRATLSFHTPASPSERDDQVVHLAEFPQVMSDEEYVQALLRIRRARYAVVGPSTTYIAEALALGTPLLLGDNSVSELIDLEEGTHYFRLQNIDEIEKSQYEAASLSCIAHHRANCDADTLARRLLDTAFVRHIKSSDLKDQGELSVISVHDASDVVEESDS